MARQKRSMTLLFALGFAATARAETPRANLLCSHPTQPADKVLLSQYTVVRDGKTLRCAVIAKSDPAVGMTSLETCIPEKLFKATGSMIPDNPVCAFKLDMMKLTLTRRCDWSDPSSPAPPPAVYACKAVEVAR